MKKFLYTENKYDFINRSLFFGFILFSFIIEMFRLRNYAITLDEAYTYYGYVEKIFYTDNIPKTIIYYFNHPANLPANNHWLNTILIGITERITRIRYNDYVIRFPIFCFFLLHLYICCKMYFKHYISLIQVQLLVLGYYFTEYFALARGYGYAAVLILLGIYELENWIHDNDKSYYLIFAISAFTFAETANTVSLLPILAIYIAILTLLIKYKLIQTIIRSYFLPLLFLVILNLLMVKNHFNIATADSSLYFSNGSFIDFLKEYTQMIIPNSGYVLISLFGILLIIRLWRICHTGFILEKFIFMPTFLASLLITFVAIKLFGAGYPGGRELVPSFPLFIIALGELADSNPKNTDFRSMLCYAFIILIAFFQIKQTNYMCTSEWPTSSSVKDIAYEIYRKDEYASLRDFHSDYYNSSINYYRRQILYKYNYDILPDEAAIDW